MTTTHEILVIPVDPQRAASYGITHASEYVYRTTGHGYPTRVQVWDNTRRPNPRDGQTVRYGQYGKLDGGNGRFLDPHHDATDMPVSVLLSPEASVITA